jgi:FkbM family methyltransferase
MSWLTRNVLPKSLGPYLQIALTGRGADWPDLDFSPRRVRVGSVDLFLKPHLGEFDQQALFTKVLDYEPEVVAWLSQNVGGFDSIIEIGANVGVHSLLIAHLLSDHPSARVHCFEPSPEAAARFRSNVSNNPSDRIVFFELAIGLSSGFIDFFCPRGHLTNGSMRRDFAEIFSDQVRSCLVPCFSPAELRRLFSGRTLVKMDVEGFEPELLACMSDLLWELKPHLIVEVLPGTDEYLNKSDLHRAFEFHHIARHGLSRCDVVFAHPSERDWLLVPRS